MPSQDPDITLSVADASRRAREKAGGPRTGRSLHPTEFGEKLQEHARVLWCIAVGVTGDRSAAEDLVQEAALVALGKLNEFDPGTSFAAWMGQIVRYLALNERRRRARERAALGDTGFADAVGPRPLPSASGTASAGVSSKGELLTDQRLFDDDLAAAVCSLEEVPRSCLLLRIVLELPYRQIAHILGIPEGTAMSHVHRGRRALRDYLSASMREGTGPGPRSSP